jgi:hypothetical protein
MYKTARFNKKSGKMILFIVIIAVVALLITRCAVVRGGNNVKVAGAADIAVFLSGFGWEVNAEPVTLKNVQIPAKFNEAYERYNALQKRQGFDLSRHRADIAESYTFRVLNHPAAGDVFANVLVFRGRIIGGDICSFALDGFMTGFDGQLTINN